MINKCKFSNNCDGYKPGSKRCNHKGGKHCKISKKRNKTRKKIRDEVLVLNNAIECDMLELATESRNRLRDIELEDKQVKITNLLDALSSRFEKKIKKQKMRDIN